MAISTGFLDSDGNDASTGLVPKSYLLERYPEMVATYKNGGLYSWGVNDVGQLGHEKNVGTNTAVSSPIIVGASTTSWKTLSTSSDYISYCQAAIKTDGSLWLWGLNTDGNLGNNSRTSTSSPVQTVSGGTNWKQVSMGSFGASVAAIKTDGTLWTWGYNENGQLGSNSVASRSSPGQTVSGGTTWRQVSMGFNHTSAIKTDGTLWTWGLNDRAQLGTGNYTYRSSPGQISGGGTTWRQVSGTAAIKTDGTLWTWGTSDLWTHLTPTQMGTDTNWKQISDADSRSRAAIKTDGTLWTWGYNNYGQLGTGNTTSTNSPVQTILGGTDWHSIKFNGNNYVNIGNMMAMKTDGSLWRWGNSIFIDVNEGGFYGNGEYRVSTPRMLKYGGKNIIDATGGFSIFIIRDDSEDLL